MATLKRQAGMIFRRESKSQTAPSLPPSRPKPKIVIPSLIQPYLEKNDPESNEFHFKSDELINITKTLFFRSSLTINGLSQDPKATQINLKWLTISSGVVTFNNVYFKAKIQVSTGATLILNNCIVEPYDPSTLISIEAYSKSSVKLSNCTLTYNHTELDPKRFSLLVRDNSEATISNCTFSSNCGNLVLLQGSRVHVDGSKFGGPAQKSVFLTQSSGTFENCEFNNMEPVKGCKMLCAMNSKVTLLRCNFHHIGIGIFGVNSTIQICESVFRHESSPALESESKQVSSCCIFVKCQSNLSCHSCTFQDWKGNGINMDNSQGYVANNTFMNVQETAIVIFGIQSNPVIYNNTISNSHVAIAARDISRPLIRNHKISNIKFVAFSISDFAQPLIDNTTITEAPLAFSVSNGAKVKIQNAVLKAKEVIDVFTEGIAYIDNPEFKEHSIERLNGKILSISSKHWSDAPHVLIVEKDPGQQAPNVMVGKSIFEAESTQIQYPFPNPPDLPKPLPCLRSLSIPKHKHLPDDENKLCLVCKKNPATNVVMPCGHVAFCQDCADNPPHTCPVCNSYVLQTPKLFKSDECVICLEKKADTICSCGHQCVCFHCAIKLNAENRCPLCQASLFSIKHSFL